MIWNDTKIIKDWKMKKVSLGIFPYVWPVTENSTEIMIQEKVIL